WIAFRGSSEWPGAPRGVEYAKSKEDGSFVLDGVPGGDITLTVGARDHAYREIEIAVDEKTLPQEIALSSGGTIAGIVKTASGAPISGEIMLSGPDVSYLDKTDDSGRFSFEHMRAGNYSLWANAAAGSVRHELALGPDERKEEIELVVGAGGH